MTEYDFKLKFALPSDSPSPDELTERLGEAGCDDALVGIGQPGRIALDFSREAASARSAVISALSDVKRAIPGARLIEVAPDLVGLSDVADLVGVSRQNLRKLWLAHATDFPIPIHEGSSTLWHLAAVLRWLVDCAGYQVDRRLIEVAETALQVNLLKESDHRVSVMPKKLRTLVA